MDLDVDAINMLSQLSVTSNSVRDWEVVERTIVGLPKTSGAPIKYDSGFERTIVGLLNIVVNSVIYVVVVRSKYQITFQFYTKVVQ
jgi:hypothetical protein